MESYVRSVGGELVSSDITHTPAVRIEVLRRETSGRMHWHFRQPEIALFWFRRGAVRLNATIDGHSVSRVFSGKSQLAVFPAGSEIEGEWDTGPNLDYTVIFLDPQFVRSRLQHPLKEACVAFRHDALINGIADLARESKVPDELFDLVAEGWGMQALAHLARLTATSSNHHLRGGLSARVLRQVGEYVEDRLGSHISVACLAAIAGLSERHFLRAFQDSTGMTPYGFVLERRVESAKRRLTHSADSITDVALATGFGQPQHFSSRFKQVTGLTPSSFRQRSLS